MNDLITTNFVWEDSWTIALSNQENLAGGQGTVRRVVRKLDGIVGALKELHNEHQKKNERRFRMSNEVGALKVLEGIGTPKIYDSNEKMWENKEISLYVIMEWIEGPTLAEYVNGKALPIDDALIIIDSLINIIESCHRLEIYHRDIKPDNIILRSGKIAEPVLVDFGMAWCKPNEDEVSRFETNKDQELGNRFLRLPEYIANRHFHDPRSDITVLVGLLFYCLTGKSPRALRDAKDRMPQESEILPESLYQDPRWKKLNRLFEVGFQQSLERRFQSFAQLRHFLASLMPTNDDNNSLQMQQELLKEVLRTKSIEEHKQIANTIKSFSTDLVSKIISFGTSIGFTFTGNNTIDDKCFCYKSNFGMNLHDIPTPRVSFCHTLKYEAGNYIADYRIVGTPIQKEYYRGPYVDAISLSEALTPASKEIYEHLIVIYRSALEAILS